MNIFDNSYISVAWAMRKHSNAPEPFNQQGYSNIGGSLKTEKLQ
jgi:hypothetical protein